MGLNTCKGSQPIHWAPNAAVSLARVVLGPWPISFVYLGYLNAPWKEVLNNETRCLLRTLGEFVSSLSPLSPIKSHIFPPAQPLKPIYSAACRASMSPQNSSVSWGPTAAEGECCISPSLEPLSYGSITPHSTLLRMVTHVITHIIEQKQESVQEHHRISGGDARFEGFLFLLCCCSTSGRNRCHTQSTEHWHQFLGFLQRMYSLFYHIAQNSSLFHTQETPELIQV